MLAPIVPDMPLVAVVAGAVGAKLPGTMEGSDGAGAGANAAFKLLL